MMGFWQPVSGSAHPLYPSCMCNGGDEIMSVKWTDVFDRIYVVSMPGQVERRRYVEQHLKEHGVTTFEWHDAIGPQHPSTIDAMESGLVRHYPPCFRCELTECGDDHCNNTLIPEQVATFLTYIELFKKIMAPEIRALVLEDDVRFHPAWDRVLQAIVENVESGRLPFRSYKRCLLRLGWALGDDHDQPGPVRFSDTVRMATACFAITSAMARKAVSEFRSIRTTADIYLHKETPGPGQAFTVFPPIASELSWSTGELKSLIRPKHKRVQYLEAQGRLAEADEERVRLKNCRDHKFHRRFLVTGHPRTGTGYIASLLGQMGFDVGHEKAGADGLSSWMFAADAQEYPYALDGISAHRDHLHWDLLLHVVRDPATAIPSIIRENRWAPPSYAFRRSQILKTFGVDLDACGSELERAIRSLVYWTRLVADMRPAVQLRLEDAHETLPRFLFERGLVDQKCWPELDTAPVNANKKYKGVRHPLPDVDWNQLVAMPEPARSELEWYCGQFKYTVPEPMCVRQGR